MSLGDAWRGLRGSGDRELREAVAALTAAVRDLTAAQRKQAEQLKRLRDDQHEIDARWRHAIENWQRTSDEARQKTQRDALKASEATERRWQRTIDGVRDADKTERKWRVIFARQLDAVLRHLTLARMPLPAPFDLTARRFRIRSQNEEDGMLLALLERAGISNARFVEIGSGRSGGNAALLAGECGWAGLMIDLDGAAMDSLRRRFAHNPRVQGVVAAVTPRNVDDLLRDHGFAGDLDLLSIDIDSYDYWVLQALTAASPRVLMLEYNAAFGPERAVTIPDRQPLEGAPKAYRGASLAALDALARSKGYRLVACEPSGVNAFFLRHDVAPEIQAVPVAQAFRPALSRLELAESESAAEPALVPGDASFPLIDVP